MRVTPSDPLSGWSTAKLHRRLSVRWLAVCATAWLSLFALHVGRLWTYSTTPGAQEVAPATWPEGSRIPRVEGRSTLVMFVHPQCPCSRASLSELDVIMNAAAERAAAVVVFLRPEGAVADWEHTGTWDAAGRIPGVTRFVDGDGAEAKLFGAKTSGQVVLYDARGHSQFSGGITGSRGHEGDNVGRRTVEQLVAHVPTLLHGHAVFGCPMASQAAGELAPGARP
jgi:hypothetical protein